MINLREKYQNEIAAIKADAQANLDEAIAIEKDRTSEMQDCSNVVAQLQEKATSSHRAFFKMAFNILKLALTRKPTIADVSIATSPVNSYTDAAAKLPEAESALYDAKLLQSQAQAALINAQDEFEIISSL